MSKPNPEFKASLIVKLNFLILGLGLTAYLIYGLNTRGIPPVVKALFGLPAESAGPGRSAWYEESFKLSWCLTRVVSLVKPQGFKLAQEGRAWIFSTPEEKVLDFVAVEKWFGRYCRVNATGAITMPGEGSKPELFIKFVNGETEVLSITESGLFIWQDKVFSSPELSAALAELPQLPAGVRR